MKTTTTTPEEFKALPLGAEFTWTCSTCGEVQTDTKFFDSLPTTGRCDKCW